MLFAVLGNGLIKLFEQIFLLLRQIVRRFHKNMNVKVAHVARAKALHTLAAQAQNLAALRAFRNRDAGFAVKHRHIHIAP